MGHRHSIGAGRSGARSRRTQCELARLRLFLFVASCLSNVFARSGKRSLSGGSIVGGHMLLSRVLLELDRPASFRLGVNQEQSRNWLALRDGARFIAEFWL